MASILDLMNHVQQQGEIGTQRAKTTRLGQLMAQGYQQGGDRSQLMGQIAQVDPNAAIGAQKSFGVDDDAKMERIGQMANMLLAMPAETRAQAYPGMVAQLHQMGLGEGLQPNWSEDLLPTVQQIAQQLGGGGDDLKSLRIGANGNYWAIRGGQFVDTGTPAAPNTYVRDQPGTPFDILDKRTGGSIYGQQQPQQGQPQQWAQNGASYQTPAGIVKLDGVAPEDMAAVQADMLSGGAQDNYALPPRDVSPQGRPPSRPDPSAAITPYQRAQLGMQQQRLEASQQAAQRAAEAAQAAQAAKQQVAAGKAQKARVAAQDSVDAYTDAISTIDTMRSHPGYADLGTPMGDIATNIPVIRTDAKGANASLETLKSQIMINTLSKLKALSATGAAGFGALNQSEGDALRRAIANLDTAQSHADLDRAVLRVREVMQRSAQRIAEAAGGLGQDAQQPAAPQAGGNYSHLWGN